MSISAQTVNAVKIALGNDRQGQELVDAINEAGSIGTAEIADGAVTPAKQSQVARTRTIVIPLKIPAPTGADQLNLDRYLFTAPAAFSIVGARLTSSTATSGSDAANQYKFVIRNQSAAVNLGTVTTDTNGSELAAETPKALTIDQNTSLSATAKVGIRVSILDSGAAGPTDLSAANLRVEVDYVI